MLFGATIVLALFGATVALRSAPMACDLQVKASVMSEGYPRVENDLLVGTICPTPAALKCWEEILDTAGAEECNPAFPVCPFGMTCSGIFTLSKFEVVRGNVFPDGIDSEGYRCVGPNFQTTLTHTATTACSVVPAPIVAPAPLPVDTTAPPTEPPFVPNCAAGTVPVIVTDADTRAVETYACTSLLQAENCASAMFDAMEGCDPASAETCCPPAQGLMVAAPPCTLVCKQYNVEIPTADLTEPLDFEFENVCVPQGATAIFPPVYTCPSQ